MVDELICFLHRPRKIHIRTPISGLPYQDSHIRTPISGLPYQDSLIRTPISGLPYQNSHIFVYNMSVLQLLGYRGLPTKDETFPAAKYFFLSSLQNHQIRHFKATIKAKDLIQTLNRYISRVLSRLYSLILCGYPCI